MYAGENPVLHIFQPRIERSQTVTGVYGIAHLALHIADFDAAKTRLEEHNILYEVNIMESRKARQLFIDGPDGVQIELIELGAE